MSIAVEFAEQLEPALAALAQDEWAVAGLRERIVQGVDAATALSQSIPVGAEPAVRRIANWYRIRALADLG